MRNTSRRFTAKGAPDIVKLQKNPNVTVRMRGVMEKCTFCVQRIEEAKIAARVRVGASGADHRIPRDSFTSACAQACPNDAIVFGDINDPESRVSKMKKQDRNYRLLEYLNVNTRTSYLARIRNPNPKMPDAKNIGVASPGGESMRTMSISPIVDPAPRALLPCHPERSEGPRISFEAHPNVHCVINQLLGGPSPSARLGMTVF